MANLDSKNVLTFVADTNVAWLNADKNNKIKQIEHQNTKIKQIFLPNHETPDSTKQKHSKNIIS